METKSPVYQEGVLTQELSTHWTVDQGIFINCNIPQENPLHKNTITKVRASSSIKNGNKQAVIWPIMNTSKNRLVIQTKTQIGATEIDQLNKVTNIPNESSCQGEGLPSKINKENLSSEQVIKLTNLQNENKRLKEQLDTQSKHENKMQNMKSSLKKILDWPMTSSAE